MADALAIGQSNSLYSYCLNNPVNYKDPDGMTAKTSTVTHNIIRDKYTVVITYDVEIVGVEQPDGTILFGQVATVRSVSVKMNSEGGAVNGIYISAESIYSVDHAFATPISDENGFTNGFKFDIAFTTLIGIDILGGIGFKTDIKSRGTIWIRGQRLYEGGKV